MLALIPGLVFIAASCREVSETASVDGTVVVSHESTRDITVWTPPGEGPWPIVYTLHGLGGGREDWSAMAGQFVDLGFIVFAADYRSWEGAANDRWDLVEQDTECAYRYVLTIAEDHGGDPTQPVTVVGFSLGATTSLELGLNEARFGPDGTYDACFSGTPRPDVIAAISGCHYELAGTTFEFDDSRWTNHHAQIVFVVGDADTVCESWQSETAAAHLASAGYQASFVEIPGANHYRVIFHDEVDGEWLTLPDDPGGQQVVQTILEAIAASR